MTVEAPREFRPEEPPVGPEGRRERFEPAVESADAVADREYRGLAADIADAERQAVVMMEAAVSDIDEMPFDLIQLKRDSDEFLRENAEVMRRIAEEARREAAAIVETDAKSGVSGEYLGYLDRHFWPDAAKGIDALPDAMKNDGDAIMALLDDKLDAAERADDEAWEDINGRYGVTEMNEVAPAMAERYARLLEKTGPEPRSRLLERFLGKRTTALERRRMLREEASVPEGGSPPDVRMSLELMRRLSLPDEQRERFVLRAIAKNGRSVLEEFPELCEGIERRRINDALVEASPLQAAEALPNEDPVRQAEVLRVLSEMRPQFAIEGLKRLPDIDYRTKVSVLIDALGARPELAGRLDELGFSPSEKLALGLRLARKHVDAYPEYVEVTAPMLSLEEKIAVTQDLLEEDPALLRGATTAMRLSHDSIVDVVRRYPRGQRGDLLEAMGVPNKDAEMLLDEAHSHSIPEAPRTPEEREAAKLVEKIDRASVDLMLAMERTVFGAADAERARVGEEQRLHGKIERVGVISGKTANSPRYVMIEGRELPAVYKSRLREQKVRYGIPEGGMVGREVLASFIDRALRLNLVPATVLRSGPEGLAAVQDWKVGDIAASVGWKGEEHREELKKLGFFDWLTANSDRHNGNWLIGKDGKHVAIDNGAIFAEQTHDTDKLRSFPLSEVHGEALPDDIRRNAADLLENREVLGILKEMFTTLLGSKDGKRAWKEFEGRLHRASDPDFRLPNSDWLVPHAAAAN